MPYGETRELQLTSLRKKIWKYKLSDSEILKSMQCKFLELRKGKHLKANFKKSNQADTTECVFRTAYYIAKNNRPYTDHPKLIDL